VQKEKNCEKNEYKSLINNHASLHLAKTKMSVHCKQFVNGLRGFPGQGGGRYGLNKNLISLTKVGPSLFALYAHENILVLCDVTVCSMSHRYNQPLILHHSHALVYVMLPTR
jgi:hypothetical protein